MRELDVYTLIFVATLIVFGALVSLFVLWRSQSRRDGAGFWVADMDSYQAAMMKTHVEDSQIGIFLNQ